MVEFSRLTGRARRLGLALAASAALAVSLGAPSANAQTQPPAEGAIARLATLHWQAVLLERMTLGACASAAGADAAATEARIESARARFDTVLGQMRDGYGATIPDERIRKQVERGLDDLSAQWWRYRGALDGVTSGRDTTPGALAGVRAIGHGMTETVDKLYSGSRRALTKAGETDMGQTMGEFSAFSHVMQAESAVSGACFAGIDGLPQEIRADADQQIELFAGEVGKLAQNPFASPEQKALAARWDEVMPRLRAAAGGAALAPADLVALTGLLDEWAAASDRLGVERRSGL